MKGKYIAIVAVFAFIFFFFSMEARAVNWKRLVTATNGDSYYYDPQSIKRVSKDIVRVWVKELGPGYKGLSCAIHLLEFNCSEKMLHDLPSTPYNRDGSFIGSFPRISFYWAFIAPDSAYELLFNIVCGGR